MHENYDRFMISKRYDHGEDMATIVTGNLSLEDLGQRYGRRLTDRFIMPVSEM